MKQHHLFTALATAIILLSSCGGAGADVANANYVDIDFGDSDAVVIAPPSGPTAVVAVATEPPASTAVNEATLTELTAVYDRFLVVRASAIIGDRNVADLSDVATQSAMSQVAGLRADNDAAHAADKYSAMTGLFEWSNVTTIREQGDGFVFTDCTERQDLNSVGIPHVRFITNDVVMVAEGDSYKVDQVTQTHTGQFAEFAGDFGCVPPSFIKRAETVTAQAITEVATLVADPGQAVNDGISETFTEEARDELAYIADLLNDQGLSRNADEQVAVQVVGMDPNKPDFTVVVSVCRYYPNGRTYVDAETGETGVSDLARGSSEEEWLFVQLESVPVGTPSVDTVTRVESKATNCWSGS